MARKESQYIDNFMVGTYITIYGNCLRVTPKTKNDFFLKPKDTEVGNLIIIFKHYLSCTKTQKIKKHTL